MSNTGGRGGVEHPNHSLDCAGIATQVLERGLQFVFLHIKQDSKGAI